jgi:arylsulfatase A-like enzyme
MRGEIGVTTILRGLVHVGRTFALKFREQPRLCWGKIVLTPFLALIVSQGVAQEVRRPNFVILLADDLGYSDIGCYGGEIETPNLDALAAGGLRYSQHYNTARCWPTRAALLSGYYAQQVGRDALPGLAGGAQAERPRWSRLLPQLLAPLGYHSYHSGKWHVDGTPEEGGFARSYLVNDHNRYFRPQSHLLDGKKLPQPKPEENYYVTTAIADHAVTFLHDHHNQYGSEPFFAYVCFTAPHFPLQALQADIDKYRERYRQGWDDARSARWERIKTLGQIPGTLAPLEPAIGPPYDFPEAIERLGPGEVNRELAWSELTPEQQEFQATKMAIHAAMVDRMDQEIGRIVEALRATGAYENTVILFLADNGASAEIMVRGDGHDPAAAPGSAATFLSLGPGWSRVANTPFRRHKTWVHEGGISTPLVVHWPDGIKAHGEWRSQVGHVIDIAPTLVELAGGVWPPKDAPAGTPEPPGRSLVPSFASESPTERTLWWLHEGNRAIRQGDWKLVAAKEESWQLYDLAHDRAETRDLSSEHPEKVAELSKLWLEMTDDMAAERGAKE